MLGNATCSSFARDAFPRLFDPVQSNNVAALSMPSRTVHIHPMPSDNSAPSGESHGVTVRYSIDVFVSFLVVV